jgi:hypothetical protein
VVVASEGSSEAAAAQHARFQAALSDTHALHVVAPLPNAPESRFRVGLGTFASREAARATRTALANRLPDDAWLFQIP